MSGWLAPTGPRAVGVIDFDLDDPSRASMYATPPAIGRRLSVTCWYPAASIDGRARRSYSLLQGAAGAGHFLAHPRFALTPEAVERVLALPTASYRDATPGEGPWPLVVFCHGGSSYHEQNTRLMEHLASHGYVVASVAHPHESATYQRADGTLVAASPAINDDLTTFGQRVAEHAAAAGIVAPDLAAQVDAARVRISIGRDLWLGRLAPVWADDLVFVADRLLAGAVKPLAGRLQAGKIGYCGMSFGGDAAALACLKDSRAGAFINLDGGLLNAETIGRELGVPVLCLGQDPTLMARAMGQVVPAPDAHTLPLHAPVYARPDGTPPSHALHNFSVRGAAHGDFTDFPALGITVPGFAVFAPAEQVMQIQCRAGLDFFDQHLRGRRNDCPDGLLAAFGEVLVRHRRAGASG